MSYRPTYEVEDLGETYIVEIDDDLVSAVFHKGKDVTDDQDDADLDRLYWLAIQERDAQIDQMYVDYHTYND
jgi:hypothetical protein